jgi:hypothetical protein
LACVRQNVYAGSYEARGLGDLGIWEHEGIVLSQGRSHELQLTIVWQIIFSPRIIDDIQERKVIYHGCMDSGSHSTWVLWIFGLVESVAAEMNQQ